MICEFTALDEQWCGCPTHTRVPKVIAKPKVKKPAKVNRPGSVKRDPFDAKVTRYATGEWCILCDTPRHRGLCECQRVERFALHLDVLTEYAKANLDTPGLDRTVRGAALGALGQETLRSGLGQRVVGSQGQTVASSVTRHLIRAAHIKPSAGGSTGFGSAKSNEVVLPA